MGLLYVKEAASALVSLFESETCKPPQIYNVPALVCTAEEIVDAIRLVVPDARIEFPPKTHRAYSRMATRTAL